MAEILSRRRHLHHHHHPDPKEEEEHRQETDMKSHITASTGSLSTLTAPVHEQSDMKGGLEKEKGSGEQEEEAEQKEEDGRSVVSELSHYDEYMKSKPSMSKANSRIVKLKKINDLQRANRALRDDNAAMKQEMREMKTKLKQTEKALQRSQRSASGAGEEKMMDAIQALRAVTLKQEKKLRALKKEKENNSAEIADRDELIDSIQRERDAFKAACDLAKQTLHANQNEITDLQRDLASSIDLVEELEDKLHHEHERAQTANTQLKQATAHLHTLEHRLEASKTTHDLTHSVAADTPAETELSQIAKLQRELSTKIEHIVLLEFELEVAREELQELRDSRTMDQVFPQLNAVEEDFSEEEFSDDGFDNFHHPPQHHNFAAKHETT